MEVHWYVFNISLRIREADSDGVLSGNYDVSELHYNGPGDVPGAPGGGYGYDIRVGDRTSA